MFYIKKSEWKRLEDRGLTARALFLHDYDGKICKEGERMVRKGRITHDPKDYSTLILEHIHFEIVDDEEVKNESITD